MQALYRTDPGCLVNGCDNGLVALEARTAAHGTICGIPGSVASGWAGFAHGVRK
jgi:hypothetical protein